MKLANFKQKRCIWIIFRMLLLLGIFSFTQTILAQVTIGSGEPPHEKALLDLKEHADGTASKGLILPRVSLLSASDYFGITDHTKGTIVYNTNTSDSSVPIENRVSAGFYYNNGARWEKLYLGYTNWFYMPSIIFDTSSTGLQPAKNLYQFYINQFKTPKLVSPGAPPSIPYLPLATDLYYYITDYDEDVFEIVSLTDEGILTYKVKQAASDYSLIDIVFVLK